MMPASTNGADTQSPKHPVRWLLACLLTAFGVLYWMFPFVSPIEIGNDYQAFSIKRQMEYQFCIEKGAFPLYIPGGTFGRPGIVISLGQLFHPISHLAAALPGYWSGHALQFNTLLRLLSLAITHFVVFAFFRRLSVRPALAFCMSFVAVYNMRMLDSFRYGASLEGYCAFLMLCCALGWHYLSRTPRLGPAAIAVCTYLLVTSGHPQWMFLAMLPALAFVLVLPIFVRSLEGPEPRLSGLWTYYFGAFLSIGVGLLLSSAYVIPYYFDFVGHSGPRIDQTHEFSVAMSNTVFGMLSNFFNPFHTDVHGAFGSTSILLIALLLPLALLTSGRPRLGVFLVWLLIIPPLLFSLGDRTPFHRIVWQYVPFFNDFRVPGRVNIPVPFFCSLLLVWLCKGSPAATALGLRRALSSRQGRLGLIALALSLYYHVFIRSGDSGLFTPYRIGYPDAPIPLVVSLAVAAFGIAALAAFTALPALPEGRVRDLGDSGLIACVMLQTALVLSFGTWREPVRTLPSLADKQAAWVESLSSGALIDSLNSAAIQTHHDRLPGRMLADLALLSWACRAVSDNAQAYDVMARERPTQSGAVIVEARDPGVLPAPSPGATGRIRLVYSSFNRLEFETTASAPCMFILTFPYEENWRVTVGEHVSEIYRVNGNEMGVAVPGGTHRVQFRYWSSAQCAGVVISLVVLFVFGAFLIFRARRDRWAFVGALALLAVIVGIALGWRLSVYQGDNLDTFYEWTSP